MANIINKLAEKLSIKTKIDPSIIVKNNDLKPGNGLDVSNGLIYIKLNDDNEKTSDGLDFLYIDDKKLTINHIKELIDNQIKNICIGAEDRDSKGYIEMGIHFNEARIQDLFLYTQYGEFSPYPSKNEGEKRFVPGVATVEDTTNYVDRRVSYMGDQMHEMMINELSKKADSDNVDLTIRAEFLGAYGVTMFDLEGRSRSVTMEHECLNNQHYVNINAEDKSGSAILVMPNNGEKKTIAYKEELDLLKEIVELLLIRIQELENKNK